MDMLATGNSRISDLLCITPPHIPDDAHVMTQLIEVAPGEAGAPAHRHSGPVFGYVVEGRILFELEGEEPREIKAGEAFWEPGGEVVHWQAANLEHDSWSRFVAVCVCAPDVEMITILSAEEQAQRQHLRHPSARERT